MFFVSSIFLDVIVLYFRTDFRRVYFVILKKNIKKFWYDVNNE
jgi:hypothetical protein